MLDEQIRAILTEQLELAEKEERLAKEQFRKTFNDRYEKPTSAIGELPHFEASELIRTASSNENHATRAHFNATMRLNRYLVDGAVPDDVWETIKRKNKTR